MTPLLSIGTTAASLPAAAGEWWGWGGILELILSGLAVVMGVLLLLAVLTALMGRVFVALETRRSRQPAAVKVSAPAAAVETGDIDPALVAVLAAAAAESLQADVRIVKIRRRPELGTEWAVQGRMTLHSSHQLWKGGNN